MAAPRAINTHDHNQWLPVVFKHKTHRLVKLILHVSGYLLIRKVLFAVSGKRYCNIDGSYSEMQVRSTINSYVLRLIVIDSWDTVYNEISVWTTTQWFIDLQYEFCHCLLADEKLMDGLWARKSVPVQAPHQIGSASVTSTKEWTWGLINFEGRRRCEFSCTKSKEFGGRVTVCVHLSNHENGSAADWSHRILVNGYILASDRPKIATICSKVGD